MVSLHVGGAVINLFNTGDLRAPLADWLGLRPAAWRGRYDDEFTEPLRLPIQSVLIQTPGATILVDPSSYSIAPTSELALPGYHPPPPTWQQLELAGIDPATVDTVVITHTHFDHFSGLTRPQGNAVVPAFPNARVYVGRADLESPALARLLKRETSLESRTLGIVRQAGLLEPADGPLDLGLGATLLSAPGETPGHQILRLTAGGQVLYCLGDLAHHPVEFLEPTWTPTWNKRAQSIASRAMLAGAALAENAVLVATHIPGFGRLQRTGAAARWVRVDHDES